jgi:hypothetical protein
MQGPACGAPHPSSPPPPLPSYLAKAPPLPSYLAQASLERDYPEACPLPPLPKRGDLDLKVVLKSPYFFS